MSQLVQIKDFQFVALKDEVNVTDKDRKSFQTMTLKDDFFSPKVVDTSTSMALLEEFDKCPYADGVFINELDTEKPIPTPTDDYVYIRASYSVKPEKIPLLLRKSGLKIQRKQLIAYIAPGNNSESPYVLVKKDGTPFESEKQPNSRANKVNIEIYDDVLALRKDEYEKYVQVEELISKGNYSHVPSQDLYLWAMTDTFVKRREKQDIVFHEMRHAQNTLILFDYLFDNPDCKLSGVDIFKRCQDDEISAKIAEAIEAINTYNTSKDKTDLSVFESSYLLQQLLYDKSIEERKRLLSDIPNIVREVCAYWYKKCLVVYKSQFVENTSIDLKQIPLKHLAIESDGTAYNNIRKLMFTYNVYDQKTGKYVNMDLSKYVIEPEFEDSMLKMTQQMYKDIVVKRQETLEQRQDRIQYDLIKKATAEYKKCVANTEYRKTLADLQKKGFDYASALNFIPGVTDVQTEPETIKEGVQPKTVTPEQTVEEPKSKTSFIKRAIHEINRRILVKRYRKKTDNGAEYI